MCSSTSVCSSEESTAPLALSSSWLSASCSSSCLEAFSASSYWRALWMAIAARLREQRHRLELALVEGALAQAVEGEHADHLVAQRERRDDARLGLPLGARHQRAARVVQHVVDQLRLVVLQDPPADADVDGAAPGAHLLAVEVVRVVAAVELVRLLVDQADLQRVVVDDLLEERGDAREDLAGLERREERAAELEDRVAQRQLCLQRRGGLLERLVLARVLDRDRRVRREHLERLDELERRQLAVGRVEEVEHAHQLVVLVVQRHEQVVVAVPLVGAARARDRARADSGAAPPSTRAGGDR